MHTQFPGSSELKPFFGETHNLINHISVDIKQKLLSKKPSFALQFEVIMKQTNKEYQDSKRNWITWYGALCNFPRRISGFSQLEYPTFQ